MRVNHTEKECVKGEKNLENVKEKDRKSCYSHVLLILRIVSLLTIYFYLCT